MTRPWQTVRSKGNNAPLPGTLTTTRYHTWTIQWLPTSLIEAKFGGQHHLFLGMDITFNNDATVTLLMKKYLKEAIADSGMDASRVAATPAKRDLFAINNKSKHLEKKRSELFLSIVAKLLYVSKRARTDLQLAVAFLCTRVSCSTEQDWDK